MKHTLKAMLSILLVFCMVLQFVPGAVLAVGTQLHTETAAPQTDLPGNDELFAMYVEQVLYDREWVTFGTAARENLNAAEQAIYDAMKAEIEAVAANGGSTEFIFASVPGLKMEWTREELGVESIEDVTEAKAQFDAQFSLHNIITALLSDCPYDLYWYDKTVGGSMNYSMGRSGISSGDTTYWTKLTFKDLTIKLSVAGAYQGGSEYAVTDDVAKVNTAKIGAQAVVDANAGKTDYEKMAAYKEAICTMVSYNDEAASDSYTGGYGDPWQLIYVFDGDDTTRVVCEGYAKAFQYLCDLSGLDCISVSGVMAGGTGSGGHMWNIATLEGANYLVDVTNCDEGTIGAPDALFLVGNPNGSVADGYVFALHGQNIAFYYDSDILDTWTEAELTLAASDYEPPCAHTGGNATCSAKAVCDLCGCEYGELGDHVYENGICTVCGTGTILNTATQTYYGTLADALAAAKSGETLQLLHDTAASRVMVYPGVTLDLNGHELTAEYLVGFESAQVVDEVGTGKLVAGMKNVVLDEGNDMIPVYDGSGYLFTKAGFAIRQDPAYTGNVIKIDAVACPVRMDVVELLKNGAADNNLELLIRLSWESDQGTGSQKFVFTDETVSEVFISNDGSFFGYGRMFTMMITGFESIRNLKADMVIVSGTDVEYGTPQSVSIG